MIHKSLDVLVLLLSRVLAAGVLALPVWGGWSGFASGTPGPASMVIVDGGVRLSEFALSGRSALSLWLCALAAALSLVLSELSEAWVLDRMWRARGRVAAPNMLGRLALVRGMVVVASAVVAATCLSVTGALSMKRSFAHNGFVALTLAGALGLVGAVGDLIRLHLASHPGSFSDQLWRAIAGIPRRLGRFATVVIVDAVTRLGCVMLGGGVALWLILRGGFEVSWVPLVLAMVALAALRRVQLARWSDFLFEPTALLLGPPSLRYVPDPSDIAAGPDSSVGRAED